MTISHLIRLALALGIIGSITLTYYTIVVRHDFEIFVNPDGLPELEEE
jgi:hypothetical protein